MAQGKNIRDIITPSSIYICEPQAEGRRLTARRRRAAGNPLVINKTNKNKHNAELQRKPPPANLSMQKNALQNFDFQGGLHMVQC